MQRSGQVKVANNESETRALSKNNCTRDHSIYQTVSRSSNTARHQQCKPTQRCIFIESTCQPATVAAARHAIHYWTLATVCRVHRRKRIAASVGRSCSSRRIMVSKHLHRRQGEHVPVGREATGRAARIDRSTPPRRTPVTAYDPARPGGEMIRQCVARSPSPAVYSSSECAITA